MSDGIHDSFDHGPVRPHPECKVQHVDVKRQQEIYQSQARRWAVWSKNLKLRHCGFLMLHLETKFHPTHGALGEVLKCAKCDAVINVGASPEEK